METNSRGRDKGSERFTKQGTNSEGDGKQKVGKEEGGLKEFS